MVGASVYSILAVLVIAIVSSTDFQSNIHNRMTRAERLTVFGSEESVPEYEVFPVSMSRTRRSVKSDNEIKLKLKLNGKAIVLNFKPTAGYLATNYTPVWLAKSDKHAYQNIRYDPLPKAMRNIGKFKMYHDVENEAAITVYTDPTEEIIIEGVVTSHFAIRSLPKRLMETTLEVGNYIVKTSPAKKRSIVSSPDEDTGYLVLFKVPAAPKNVERILVHRDVLHREKRAKYRVGKRKVPKAVYPEILILLDHNAIRNRTITQALRFILAFWNGVDLVYSLLDKPKVHVNIAGIIIAADEWATPYIAEDATATEISDIRMVASEMGRHFYNERVRFPLNRYDMIVAMTTATMCGQISGPCVEIVGDAGLGAACLSYRHVSRKQSVESTAFVHYNWGFGGVDTAIHETAHIFGVDHDGVDGLTADCGEKEGHVMATTAEYTQQAFKWSSCSRNFFRTYFASTISKCLDNKPRWSTPVRTILPGRWLSMDGQCKNEGYEKSCKLRKISICAELGCRDTRSKCTRTGRVPLSGSKCGRNKYCSSTKQCVDQRPQTQR